jgi:nitrite reductase (NADH) small subunit
MVRALTKTAPEAEGGRSEWVAVGPLRELSTDAFTIVDIAGAEIGVMRLHDNEVVAVSNVCPHRLAPICKGRVTGTMLPVAAIGEFCYGHEGAVLRCPWHGWEFDISTGSSLFGVTHRQLKTYDVQVRDSKVYVRVRKRM